MAEAVRSVPGELRKVGELLRHRVHRLHRAHRRHVRGEQQDAESGEAGHGCGRGDEPTAAALQCEQHDDGDEHGGDAAVPAQQAGRQCSGGECDPPPPAQRLVGAPGQQKQATENDQGGRFGHVFPDRHREHAGEGEHRHDDGQGAQPGATRCAGA